MRYFKIHTLSVVHHYESTGSATISSTIVLYTVVIGGKKMSCLSWMGEWGEDWKYNHLFPDLKNSLYSTKLNVAMKGQAWNKETTRKNYNWREEETKNEKDDGEQTNRIKKK